MIRTDLGIATAYAEAVSKGYTGTRDEFGQMFADFGKTAEKVTEDKKAVEQMKLSVEETKNSVDTTAAEFGQNVADKTEEAKAAITEHANTEKASATAAISEAKDAATGAITEAQTSATDAIASAKDSATAEIAKKGTDTLDTIPEDYTALTKDVNSLKEDIENLKNDLISKYSRRFAVSRSGKFSYVDFPTKTGDKGFIFVSETNASKFLSYSLFGHDAASNTFELIKEHISDIGNIYTYDNSSGYDYLRIFFECSAPSTEDEYLTCVFTKDTDTDAFGLITKLFADVKNMKEISATTTKVNIPDVAYEDVLSTTTIKASNSKKNNIIGFEANFENMGSVRIAHGTSYDSNRSASIVVDATNIYLYDKSTNLRATYPHSLSMDKFITVSIVVGHTRTAKIILTTANGRFTQDDVYWGGCCEDITAQVVSGTFTNARLTWYVPDYNYDLWCFGDSYFDFWGLDVIQRLGFHNFMFDGFGGRDSTDAFVSLELALEKAVPKKIMWCLGMNDRDTETAINAKWKETVDSIIDLCNTKGIELILCTIPETPVAVHTFKNAYVKASGKRYVDVCHAVGADVSNAWYDGMLNETDKIHPTDLGKSVIADYMIANVPELCVN